MHSVPVIASWLESESAGKRMMARLARIDYHSTGCFAMCFKDGDEASELTCHSDCEDEER